MIRKDTANQAYKIRQTFQMSLILMNALILVACTNQSTTPTKTEAVASSVPPDGVVQVEGSINPNDVIQVDQAVEPDTQSELLTPAGAVSFQSDRIVQVVNRAQPFRSVVTVLDATGNQLVQRELQWLVGPVKFTPDSQQIVTSGSDLATRIWDLQLNQIASFDKHQSFVQSLQVSPDGNYILTTEYPDTLPATQPANSNIVTIRLLDLQGAELASFEELPLSLRNSVQFSPDGQHLLTVIDGTVQLTDLQKNPQLTFNQNQQKFNFAQFSPDGRFVLAVSDETMQLWDIQGNLKAAFRNWILTPDESITSIQLSSNGELIATGSSNGILRFWSSQTNQVVTVQAHEGIIYAIAISPDDTQIATFGEKRADVGGDGDIRLWNRQGQLLKVFERMPVPSPTGELEKLSESFSVQFTPDGTQIIATETRQIGTTLRWKI